MSGAFLSMLRCKEPSDRIGFLFFVIATHVVAMFEVLVILPYIDNDRTSSYWFHVTLGLVLYVNIYACMYKLCTVDTSILSVRGPGGVSLLPTVLRPGWFYCPMCCVNCPPRSFHCHICNTCILRRDHHCIFTGNCVGFTNHRYFMTCLLYMAIASGYCTFLNSDYVLETLGGISVKAFLTMLLPMLAWSAGFSGAGTFAVAFISSLCIIAFIALSALFGYYLRNLLKEQTTRESSKGVHEYDCGAKSNIESIFGKRWYIAWLSPFIPSEPVGNGVEFRRKYQYENIKDM